MAGSMRAHGGLTICMEKVFTHGKMGEGMKASTSKIKNMVMGFMYGPMAEDMKAIGLMANNMVKASISSPMA
jgi:hypothetical protein